MKCIHEVCMREREGELKHSSCMLYLVGGNLFDKHDWERQVMNG